MLIRIYILKSLFLSGLPNHIEKVRYILKKWLAYWKSDLHIEKWLAYWKNELHIEKVTCIFKKWLIYWKSDLHIEKVSYIFKKWLAYWKIDLHICLALKLCPTFLFTNTFFQSWPFYLNSFSSQNIYIVFTPIIALLFCRIDSMLILILTPFIFTLIFYHSFLLHLFFYFFIYLWLPLVFILCLSSNFPHVSLFTHLFCLYPHILTFSPLTHNLFYLHFLPYSHFAM